MPDTPTPGVNGHVLSVRLLQDSRSISSFTPAATMFGAIGLIATAGSFCLFCGNGDAGLPTVTSVSPPWVASAAGTKSTAAATATAANQLNDRFISPPFPKNEERWSLGDQQPQQPRKKIDAITPGVARLNVPQRFE